MRRNWTGMSVMTAAAVLVAGGAGLTAAPQAQKPGQAQVAAAPAAAHMAKPSPAAVARGKYLVTATGCDDCHTPWKMGANGPEPDMTLMLSGHPASLQMPPAPASSGPWMASISASRTAFAGPWGVSYTRNLTPDPETGLGQWTEQQFIDTIRTGREQGRGRELLPPMPWPAFKNFSDADLKAIFAYLRSIPAIKNKVPDPVIAAPPK